MSAPSFKRIGGHPALDFINTVSGRIPAGGRGRRGAADRITGERLVDFPTLAVWAADAGLVERRRPGRGRQRSPAAAAAEGAALERAIEFREAFYRLCRAAIEDRRPSPADVALVGAAAQEARSAQCLEIRNRRIEWVWPAGAGPDRILWALALAAVALLESDARGRIRQCPGDRCGWLFLDRSRNRSRQWCDMKDCGNLAKVRRHRAAESRSRR